MPGFDSYLVQEADGTSQFLLEDGSGSILLEIAVATGVTPSITETTTTWANLLTEARLDDVDPENTYSGLNPAAEYMEARRRG